MIKTQALNRQSLSLRQPTIERYDHFHRRELAVDGVGTAGALTITNSMGTGNLRIAGNYASRGFFVIS